MQSNFPIFLNPGAGRGAETERERLTTAFRAVGANPEIHVVPAPQLEDAIGAAIRAGAEVIGAAGGDGTLSCAANIVVETPVTLLPIPLGTLNHFATRYGIPSIDAAAHAWVKAQPVRIHVGAVNERVFINNASGGFYPHLVRHRDRMERVLPRMPAMVLAGFRVLFEFPKMQLDLNIAGRHQEVRTAAMWVGIGHNSLRLPVPGDAEVEGDVLEIVLGRVETRRAAIALSARLFFHLKRGMEPLSPNLDVFHAPEFFLQSAHEMDIALDGEAFRLRGPLHFSIRKNALRILALVAHTT